MNLRQLPIIPTIVVLIAAGIMVWLGFWQLGRAEEKAALIAKYEAAGSTEGRELVDFPRTGDGSEVWYRRSQLTCELNLETRATAGTAASGAKGWAIRALCVDDPDGSLEDSIPVFLGYSRTPDMPSWPTEESNTVVGVIAPGPRLVADPPVAGLEPLAKPDPHDLPNNHLAYAGQWFFFALTALAIYWFAIQGRLKERREEEG